MSIDVPEYKWVSKPDPNNYGTVSGCYGCAFRHMPKIPCSIIPCQKHPKMVAELITETTCSKEEP